MSFQEQHDSHHAYKPTYNLISLPRKKPMIYQKLFFYDLIVQWIV